MSHTGLETAGEFFALPRKGCRSTFGLSAYSGGLFKACQSKDIVLGKLDHSEKGPSCGILDRCSTFFCLICTDLIKGQRSPLAKAKFPHPSRLHIAETFGSPSSFLNLKWSI
jgi:hypothetical protein